MHTEFHKDWFRFPKYVKGVKLAERNTHRQQSDLIILIFESRGNRVKQYRNR
jgi:hypothetical protein